MMKAMPGLDGKSVVPLSSVERSISIRLEIKELKHASTGGYLLPEDFISVHDLKDPEPKVFEGVIVCIVVVLQHLVQNIHCIFISLFMVFGLHRQDPLQYHYVPPKSISLLL